MLLSQRCDICVASCEFCRSPAKKQFETQARAGGREQENFGNFGCFRCRNRRKHSFIAVSAGENCENFPSPPPWTSFSDVRIGVCSGRTARKIVNPPLLKWTGGRAQKKKKKKKKKKKFIPQRELGEPLHVCVCVFDMHACTCVWRCSCFLVYVCICIWVVWRHVCVAD